MGHNPYFNRWFSAIKYYPYIKTNWYKVTILILIDGFLQFKYTDKVLADCKSQSLF